MAYAYTTYIILQTTLMHGHMCIHALYLYIHLYMQESGLVLVKWINALVSGDAVVTMQNEPEE